MHFTRTNCILRTLIVAMTLAGWFVLSNHCALARVGQSSQAKLEHACCRNGEPKPVNQPADGGMQCCKSLHALMPDGAKVADLAPPIFVVAVLASVLSLDAEAVEPAVQAADTDPPPRAASFSELVLHRSLRSHAPPFLA